MPWYSSTKRRVPKKQFKETKERGEGRAGVCKLHAEWNKASDKRNGRTIARAHPEHVQEEVMTFDTHQDRAHGDPSHSRRDLPNWLGQGVSAV